MAKTTKKPLKTVAKTNKTSSRVRKAAETARERTIKKSAEIESITIKQRIAKLVMLPFKLVLAVIKSIFRVIGFILRLPMKIPPIAFIVRIIGKILFVSYFINSWKEVRQVTWPDRRQTLRLTVAVFIFSITFGVAVSLVDYGLDKVIKRIVFKS
jgi:preprotein translocase SecE subunit